MCVGPPLEQPVAHLAERERAIGEQLSSEGGELVGVDTRQAMLEVGLEAACVDGVEERAKAQTVLRGDQVDRGAHQGDPHQLSLLEQRRDLLRVERLQAAPQPDVPGLRGLCLKPDQVGDEVSRRQGRPLEQMLAPQRRAVERATVEQGGAVHGSSR